MKHRFSAYRAVAIAIAIFVSVVTVYRAWTQSIAHDEALTYVWFLDGPAEKMLKGDSNNHLLFTLMAKPMVQIFGVTELSLRMPTLLGSAGYLTASFLLSAELFGESIWLPLCIALLSLNPTVMDFLVAARGYGLGLAFLAGAMLVLTRAGRLDSFEADHKRRRSLWAVGSILLALSVAANLTNLIPAISLGCAFVVIVWPRLRGAADVPSSWREIAKWFALPGFAVGLAILWPFLIQLRRKFFTIGYASVADSMRDLFDSSFLYRWTSDPSSDLSAALTTQQDWAHWASNLGTFLLLPLLLVFVVAGFMLLRKTNRSAHCRLLVGALLSCLALIFAFHFVLHMKYPLARVCLYLIPLLTLSVLVVVRDLSVGGERRWLAAIAFVLAFAAVLDYAAEFNTACFRYNAYDDISRDIYLRISDDARQRGSSARVGGTWWYWPEMDFYRRRYHADWMPAYEVKDPTQPWANADNPLRPADYDYFVYTPQNIPDLSGHQVRTIFQSDKRTVTVVRIEK